MNYIKALRWIVLGLLLLVLILIALSLVTLRERVDKLDLGNQTGPVWFMTGIEFELLQLEKSLLAYTNGITNASDVNLRFDILWSRISTALEGSNSKTLESYGVDTQLLSEIFAELRLADQGIVSLPDRFGEENEVAELLTRLSEYNQPLRDMSLKVLRNSSNEAKGWRDDLVVASDQISFLLGVTAASFVILVAVFLLESFSSRRTLKEKEQLLKKANEASLAKSQFISVMNHELRTPLTSIHGSLTMLGSGLVGEFTEKQTHLLDMARRNSQHLASLIEDVLDFQRFSDNRIKMDIKAYKLSGLVLEERADLAAICESREVNFVVEDCSQDAVCKIDPKRFRQVLINLISNAAKFSSAGNHVTLRLSRDSGSVLIEVLDTGVGISPDHHGKLFKPFYQVDSSDQRNHSGTGLGLSISKSIVEKLGGRIWFDSMPGTGTTFFVSLPEVTAN